jgi:hypothetical protein
MESWQRISLAELQALVEAQLADCSADHKALFERLKIAPRQVPIDRNGKIENVFVVAQLGNLMLYYEDVEEGFNISRLSLDGAIDTPGSEQWELCHALAHFVAA